MNLKKPQTISLERARSFQSRLLMEMLWDRESRFVRGCLAEREGASLMRRFQKTSVGVVLVIVSAIAVWKLILFPTYTYRYRMTVNVESDGHRHSGASVIEVRLKRQLQFLSEVPPVSAEITGEAVFVDLGEGRNVIAL